MKTRKRKSGFTLVELLVVIAIIGVLIGLLLPAVQSARESSRRSSCTNNMKQLGIGVHTFHDQAGHLPTSYRIIGQTTAPRISWVTFMLPQIEQQSIYDKYDQTQQWQVTTPGVGVQTQLGVSNSQIVATRISVLECPSAPDPNQRLDSDPQTSAWNSFAAPIDYSPITRVESRLFTGITPAIIDANSVGNGALPKDTRSGFRDITDGLSNTILLAESAGRPLVYRLGRLITTTPLPLATTTPDHWGNGGGWCRPASDFGLDGSSWDGTQFPGPCAINCTNTDDTTTLGAYPNYTYYKTDGMGEVYAFHPNGSNILFADGAVKFIGNKIDIRIFARLVTRANNELPVSPKDIEAGL